MVVVKYQDKSGQEKTFYIDGYLQSALDEAKSRVLNKNWDYLCIISGLPGCLTGDTIIRTNRASLGRKHTLKWMYNQLHGNPDNLLISNKWNLDIPTYVRSFDNEEKIIKLNKIKDVIYSGKKEVYLLMLTNGQSLKATDNHKVMTQGGFKELLKLDLSEDLIMCDTPTPKKSGRQEKVIDIEISGVKFHPRVKQKTRNRIYLHQAIYEANINNLNLQDYIKIISTDEKESNRLKFILDDFVIHHKDNNHFNNDISNLDCISNSEHRKIHSKEVYKNFSQGKPDFVKIKEIIKLGIEDTYDIQCEEIHNFVANGIVVHNSGKSTLAKTIAKYCCPRFDDTYVCFTDDEFIKLTNECPEYSSVVLDESFASLNTKISMTPEFLRIISHIQLIRQKHLFIILCLPNFFDLSKSVSVFRSSHLFVTYDLLGDRGYFLAFDRDKKRKLYVLGNKFMDYNCVEANFHGGFALNKDIIDEDTYAKMKKEHLLAQDKHRLMKLKIKEVKNYRDVEIGILYYDKKWSVKEISDLKQLSERTIYDILDKIRKERGF